MILSVILALAFMKPDEEKINTKVVKKEAVETAANVNEEKEKAADDSYDSEEYKKIAELMDSKADFLPLVNGYYGLPKEIRSEIYDNYIVKKEVSWSGVVADVDAISDSLVIYGNTDSYNGENWAVISDEKKDMLPYVFIAELKNEAEKQGLKNGDTVTITGVVGSRGDKDLQYNWKLYESTVASATPTANVVDSEPDVVQEQTPVPNPEPTPVPEPEPQQDTAPTVYFKNCTEARAAGAAPVYSGQPGYGKHLDRDGDGIGCDK
ncbi:excalibur calcium-binding domain-containing protein [Bacillus benzoevorans]|uniref:Excalibur calcium-binding domain-containing protein n=1 Tax=Bacillus benzoevorans TaxID=1456 RepID=A0A7X0LXK5_9BACI|nr:excalibur calcium-binding domain-containing protein [Bacillus benzoevorans]MBB6446519.1 hypothetical protein [Bacillus benzoevorans]